jgi:hypothetical protein
VLIGDSLICPRVTHDTPRKSGDVAPGVEVEGRRVVLTRVF